MKTKETQTFLYGFYCKKDKRAEYDIITPDDYWGRWIWFYVGRYIKKGLRQKLYPYKAEETKLIKAWDTSTSAYIVGKKIIEEIDKYERSIKSKKKSKPS